MDRNDEKHADASITEEAPGAVAATRTGTLLSGPTYNIEDEAPEAGEDPSAVAWDPLGRYRRLELLGAGGMGEVTLCRDEWVGREVALKTLRADRVGSEESRKRFLREMRVQGRLEHPSIVPVHDFGVDARGQAYFTMRRIHGRTMRQVLDGLAREEDGPWAGSRHRLLTAFMSVCRAVQYAHSRGVLHRDLKPSNVMLGEFGEVYVLDWGIAKVVERKAGPRGDSTSRGQIMGTPAYMAPEQLLGKRVLDARADVYALGVMLFEILTSQPLHRSREASEILEATLRGLDTRPSSRAPDVGPELDAICVRATERDPEKRYVSVADMSGAIERYLDGDRDIAQRRATAAEHAEKAAQAAERSIASADAGEAEAARADAMREVVTSLTFDPTQVAATRTLVELLVRVPEKMPAEVEKEMVDATNDARRQIMKMWPLVFVMWLAFVPIAIAMGVRSWPALALSTGLCLADMAVGLWLLRTKRTTAGYVFVIGVLVAATIASLSTWLGPFIMVSNVAAVLTMIGVMFAMKSERPALIVMGVLIVVVPAALQFFGVVPPSYAFEGGNMVVLARGYELTPRWTLGLLFYMSVSWIVVPALLVARTRDALSRAQRDLFLHAWHFRRLLPEDRTEVRVPPPSVLA